MGTVLDYDDAIGTRQKHLKDVLPTAQNGFLRYIAGTAQLSTGYMAPQEPELERVPQTGTWRMKPPALHVNLSFSILARGGFCRTPHKSIFILTLRHHAWPQL